MHDGSAPLWRQTLDRHHTSVADELGAQWDAEIASSIAQAVSDAVSEERDRAESQLENALADERTHTTTSVTEQTLRRVSESLNQTLRRIRQTSAEHETLQLLLEESAAYSGSAVVVLIENHQGTIAAWRGMTLRDEEEAAPIDLHEAAALASCAETRDPLVALSAPGEISAVLATAIGKGGEKVYLFPVTVRQITVALMAASGEVIPAPIELLCEAAGMKLEALEERAPEPVARQTEPLVQIAGTPNGRVNTWSNLTPEEQALHLKAQRTAKVRVAQMRISEPEALRRGVQAHDIYGALRTSIDAARREYHQTHMSQTPTMVDYLHLEIIRSLAHDDSRLLGGNYPGPIA